jgi:hypothetical protein
MSESRPSASAINAQLPSLPYRDTKAVGAADFYMAINATFRFILDRLGMVGLRRYWADIGTKYYAPVSTIWKTRGLEGVGAYWRDFFKAEPGADVEVAEDKEQVVLTVNVCPAIQHLRKHKREIVSCFCQHCYYVNEAIATPAGLTVRVEGGNGSCRQVFRHRAPGIPAQDFSKIREAA